MYLFVPRTSGPGWKREGEENEKGREERETERERLVATAGFNQEQDACNEITISLHAD